MGQIFWVKWQERSDRRKNPAIYHVAKTSTLEAALAVYISLRNDNAMVSVTVGYTVSKEVELSTGTYGTNIQDHIMKEYAA